MDKKLHREAKKIPIQSRLLYNTINGELQKQWNLDPLADVKIKQPLERLGFRPKRSPKGVIWSITREKIQEAKERVGLVEPTQATLAEMDSSNESVESVGNVGSVAS